MLRRQRQALPRDGNSATAAPSRHDDVKMEHQDIDDDEYERLVWRYWEGPVPVDRGLSREARRLRIGLMQREQFRKFPRVMAALQEAFSKGDRHRVMQILRQYESWLVSCGSNKRIVSRDSWEFTALLRGPLDAAPPASEVVEFVDLTEEQSDCEGSGGRGGEVIDIEQWVLDEDMPVITGVIKSESTAADVGTIKREERGETTRVAGLQRGSSGPDEDEDAQGEIQDQGRQEIKDEDEDEDAQGEIQDQGSQEIKDEDEDEDAQGEIQGQGSQEIKEEPDKADSQLDLNSIATGGDQSTQNDHEEPGIIDLITEDKKGEGSSSGSEQGEEGEGISSGSEEGEEGEGSSSGSEEGEEGEGSSSGSEEGEEEDESGDNPEVRDNASAAPEEMSVSLLVYNTDQDLGFLLI